MGKEVGFTMGTRLGMGSTEGNGAGGVMGKVSESKGRPDISTSWCVWPSLSLVGYLGSKKTTALSLFSKMSTSWSLSTDLADVSPSKACGPMLVVAESDGDGTVGDVGCWHSQQWCRRWGQRRDKVKVVLLYAYGIDP